MKGLSILIWVSVVSLFFCQINKEQIRKLIDKIDSVEIKDREAALNELKNMATNNKEILEFLKSESENESNSYNIRFFLKKLIREVEQKDGRKNEEHNTDFEKGEDDKKIEIAEKRGSSKISITLCENNKCEKYEASSCEELLKKYPNLQGKFNCNNDFSFKLFFDNNVNRKLKKFKMFAEDRWKDIFEKH
ncbi:MAG: hypothetical protein ACK4NF_07250, partial [Planctomycetota bacterium]